jgi:hypothetical protein
MYKEWRNWYVSVLPLNYFCPIPNVKYIKELDTLSIHFIKHELSITKETK